jgi:hypothetical protein
MKYSITERQKDKVRLAKLGEYRGPDDDTIKLLDQHKEEWLRDPSSFWRLPSPPNANLLDPQAQVVGCFLQAKNDDV